MLKDLKDTSVTLSLEAHCGEASLENALDQLPDFIGQIRSFFTDKIGSPLKINFVGINRFWFNKSIMKTTYTDFKNVTVFVPQGLDTTYLDYQSVLTDAVAASVKLEEAVLDPLIKWLGERLGNPMSLSSSVSALRIPGFAALKIEAIEERIHESFIKTGQKQSEVPYPQAIRRQGDWDTMVKGIESMEMLMTEDYHKRLLEKMRRLDDLLATLVRRVKESPETYKFSSQALADLATTTYTAARHLEFYGLTKYRLEEYSTAVRDSIAKLEVFVK